MVVWTCPVLFPASYMGAVFRNGGTELSDGGPGRWAEQNNRFVLQHRFSFQTTKHPNTQKSPNQNSAQQKNKTDQHHNTPEAMS